MDKLIKQAIQLATLFLLIPYIEDQEKTYWKIEYFKLMYKYGY